MIKRKDGLWQEAITIEGKRKYFYGKTKAEVLRKLAAFKDQREKGSLFSDVADAWDTEHREAVTYSGHQAYSVAYRSAVSHFGDMPIKDITAKDIDLYIKRIAAQGYAKRTVQIHLTLFNLIFKYAMLRGECEYNPASVVSIPRGLKTTKRELPTSADIDIIKNSIDAPFGLFAYFILYTGLRRGEALALTYDDIDFDKKLIKVSRSLSWPVNAPVIKEPKTEAGNRTVILLDVLADKLPRGKGYVFGGEKPMTQSTFVRAWERYVKATGITFTPHQLRHLYATILYEANIDEKLAQELMGHSSITVTRAVYTHIRRSRLDEAAAVLNSKFKV